MAGAVPDVLYLPDPAGHTGTLEPERRDQEPGKKKLRPSSRELNTPLFLLRCCQVGISIRDLDLLTVGMVMDMFTEQQNDSYKYPRMATQEDFNKF